MIYLTMFPVCFYVATLPGQSYSHPTPVCVVTSQGQQCPLSTPVLVTGPAMFPLYSCHSYHITRLAMPSTPPTPTPNVLTLQGLSGSLSTPVLSHYKASHVVTLQGQPCGRITRPAMWSHYKASHVVTLQGQPYGRITRLAMLSHYKASHVPSLSLLYYYHVPSLLLSLLSHCSLIPSLLLCCHITAMFPLCYYVVTLQPCSLSTIMLSHYSHVPSTVILSHYSHVPSLHPSNLCCHFVGPTRSSRHEG